MYVYSQLCLFILSILCNLYVLLKLLLLYNNYYLIYRFVIGGIVRLLGGGIAAMGRSLVSKIVSAEEIGKIFSFIVTLETLSGSVSTPLYTYVYNSTINYNPGAIFFVSAGLIVLNIFVTL